jgi:hypothetical protein
MAFARHLKKHSLPVVTLSGDLSVLGTTKYGGGY